MARYLLCISSYLQKYSNFGSIVEERENQLRLTLSYNRYTLWEPVDEWVGDCHQILLLILSKYKQIN